MPKNSHNHDDELRRLQALGFVAAKDHLIAKAKEVGRPLSVRRAKGIAGQIMSCATGDDYKRIVYRDKVGEGVAARWQEFKHHEGVVTA